MNIKIKNLHVSTLITILKSLELKSKKSRMRTRFKNLLVEHENKIINPERASMIEQYVQYDENKKPLADEHGNLIFSDEHTILIAESVNELMCEEYVLECNETHKDMLLTVSDIMLEGDFTVSGDYADAYDEWCEEFENVLEHYKEDSE